MNDMSTTPKVSVIMPCYNEPEEVFRRSLESVVNQTLEEIEIIIILDNPDNHELRKVIQGYVAECDKIVFLDPGKNLGKGPARNLAIEHARGKYVAIHDADDIDRDYRLEEQYNIMESHPEASFSIARVRYVDTEGNPTINQPTIRDPNAKSTLRKPFNHPTLFMATDMVRSYDGYRDISYGQDYDLFLRMLLNGEQPIYSNAIYTDYLAPVKSTHNNFVSKMKRTKLLALKRLVRYMGYPEMHKDPYYYIMFFKYIAALGILYICPSKFEELRMLNEKMTEEVSKFRKRIRI